MTNKIFTVTLHLPLHPKFSRSSGAYTKIEVTKDGRYIVHSDALIGLGDLEFLMTDLGQIEDLLLDEYNFVDVASKYGIEHLRVEGSRYATDDEIDMISEAIRREEDKTDKLKQAKIQSAVALLKGEAPDLLR